MSALQPQPWHSFVVPAYGESPHLRGCLHSLTQQTETSPIIVSTSTPFTGLERLCDELGVHLVVHSPNRGIASDWNKALDAARTEWVTLAHQDDLYAPDFVARTRAAIAGTPNAVLAFTDYVELDQHGVRERTMALRIKRGLIELGMLGRSAAAERWAKKNMLRFGCAIPCPTVTLRLSALSSLRFDTRFRVDLDWDMWLRLADLPDAAFVRDRRRLVAHRIHHDSETTAGLASGTRFREDQEMFERVWPTWFARLLLRLYGAAYTYNRA